MKFKSSTRIKMTPEERAKQFMPFAALKGYEEALRAKEIEMEYRAEHQIEGVKIEMLEYAEDEEKSEILNIQAEENNDSYELDEAAFEFGDQ